ncbi:hypothetical protein THRCLA_06483, partial [Thraustotheca clavata]
DLVCQRWRDVLVVQCQYKERFLEEFGMEYELLCLDEDKVANVQDWRILYIQYRTKFACGIHLGFDLLPHSGDNDDIKLYKAKASLLRWIFVMEQAELLLSSDIEIIMQSVNEKERLPLEEANYWQWSLMQSKPIYDQLLHPAIDLVCDVINDHDYSQKMDDQRNCLKKIYNQAVWNAKYFKVLSKPFQDLVYGDMKQIATIVPAMIKTLKMMWISSKYYNDATRMGGLLGRIAQALCTRVSKVYSIETLLCDGDFDNSISLIESAGMMLERWHEVYDPARQSWGPFDLDVLFAQVDQVAQWCSEFRSVLVILRQIKLDMIEKVQEHGTSIQIETFEKMLAEMDKNLHGYWADLPLFQKDTRRQWLDGVEFLREVSNKLLAYVHKL